MKLRGIPFREFPRGFIWLCAASALVLLTAVGVEGHNLTDHEIQRRWAIGNPTGLALIQEAMRKDSPCTLDKPNPTEDECLSRDLGCTWIKRAEGNICTPCEFEGIDIPCPPIQSLYNGGSVQQCTMNCAHQKSISLGVGACVDNSGSIALGNCLAKGQTVDPREKCMFTAFVDKNGKGKSICGPCNIAGIGEIPCTKTGDMGPEGVGSATVVCRSECSGMGLGATKDGVPCGGPPWNIVPAVTPCFNVPAPSPPPKGTVPLPVFQIHTTPDSPEYFATYVDKPYGLKQWTEAAEIAARTAGWAPGTFLPPDAAVVIYGPPPVEGPTLPPTLKVMYGPAPPGIPGVPPPGYGTGTLPPAANIEAAAEQAAFLQVKKHGPQQQLHAWQAPTDPAASVASPDLMARKLAAGHV